MEGTIGPGLLESLGGGVHSLSGGGEGACGQRLDVLSMVNFGACIDDFLSSFEQFLSKLSELANFSFDERIP